MKGYDIAEYQNAIKYQKAKADFFILRAGYRGYSASGALRRDQLVGTHYAQLYGKAKLAFYFFSQAVSRSEGIEEARFTLNVIRSIDPTWSGVVYIDTEWANTAHSGRADKITKEARTDAVQGFCDTIKQAGFKAGIYASESWFTSHLQFERIRDNVLWVANWSKKPAMKCQLWQYSSQATASWYTGRLDADESLDENIWNDLTPNPYPKPVTTVKRILPNMHGDEVKWVQFELNRRGYGLTLDGYFGIACDRATRDFQAKNGLTVDGKVGRMTREKLANY